MTPEELANLIAHEATNRIQEVLGPAGLPLAFEKREAAVKAVYDRIHRKLRRYVEEERGRAKADMAHARRSIKQACLFAAESVPLLIQRDGESGALVMGYAGGVRAAVEAVAQVEVE